MKAKRLEYILGNEPNLGEAEMVQRFQKLRDIRLLPVSRGRNAEEVTRDEIVSGLLAVVAERPGYAGMTTKVLRGLRPVGGAANAFASADTLAQALCAAFENEALLNSITEIRVTDSETYTNARGRGTIYYKIADEECVTYYVPGTALSLLQPGSEISYNPRELVTSMIRETVILPHVLKRIMREVRGGEAHARAMARPLATC